jgi:hypothetical protein
MIKHEDNLALVHGLCDAIRCSWDSSQRPHGVIEPTTTVIHRGTTWLAIKIQRVASLSILLNLQSDQLAYRVIEGRLTQASTYIIRYTLPCSASIAG